ncbi:MAG: peptidylprolyl isomerase [Clostridia bacterium]|nr:peptidylprolyl isomerase [Clostridia bacterium]
MEHPIAKIVLQSGKEIELELYPEIAPITVANFIYLANEKNLYDGLTFHRIIDNFMVQGGDPAGDGTGGPGYNIKGEFAINGVENNISHKTGVISMARRSYPYDSAGSQFFICVADATYLDGQYAAFGKVISGLENVLALGKVDTDYNDRPLEPQVIAAIRVDTRGASYEKPEGAK